jgi:thioredoxin-like negative regulator of GroEL
VAQRQSKALHRHNDWSGETIAETQRRLRGEGESLSDLKAQLAEALEAQRRSDDLASLLTARASHDELNRDQFTAPQLYCVSRIDYSRRIQDLRERIARLEGKPIGTTV